MKNGELKIERGVPVPVRRPMDKGYSAALRKLKKGESVLLPTSIQTAIVLCYYVDKDKAAFTRRREEDGVRVWRIK